MQGYQLTHWPGFSGGVHVLCASIKLAQKSLVLRLKSHSYGEHSAFVVMNGKSSCVTDVDLWTAQLSMSSWVLCLH